MKNYFRLLQITLLVISFGWGLNVQAAQSTLYASEDIELNSIDVFDPGSPDTHINIGVDTQSHIDRTQVTRYLGRFNLSSLPVTVNSLTNASIVLTTTDRINDTNDVFKIHEVNDAWGVDSVNWNNQPAYSVESYSGTRDGTGGYDKFTFNVTEMVRHWLSTGNHGFIVKKGTETVAGHSDFASAEIALANPSLNDWRPILILEYANNILVDANAFRHATKRDTSVTSGTQVATYIIENTGTSVFTIKNIHLSFNGDWREGYGPNALRLQQANTGTGESTGLPIGVTKNITALSGTIYNWDLSGSSIELDIGQSIGIAVLANVNNMRNPLSSLGPNLITKLHQVDLNYSSDNRAKMFNPAVESFELIFGDSYPEEEKADLVIAQLGFTSEVYQRIEYKGTTYVVIKNIGDAQADLVNSYVDIKIQENYNSYDVIASAKKKIGAILQPEQEIRVEFILSDYDQVENHDGIFINTDIIKITTNADISGIGSVAVPESDETNNSLTITKNMTDVPQVRVEKNTHTTIHRDRRQEARVAVFDFINREDDADLEVRVKSVKLGFYGNWPERLGPRNVYLEKIDADTGEVIKILTDTKNVFIKDAETIIFYFDELIPGDERMAIGVVVNTVSMGDGLDDDIDFYIRLEEARFYDPNEKIYYDGPDNRFLTSDILTYRPTGIKPGDNPFLIAEKHHYQNTSVSGSTQIGTFVLHNDGDSNLYLDAVTLKFEGDYDWRNGFGPKQSSLYLADNGTGERKSSISGYNSSLLHNGVSYHYNLNDTLVIGMNETVTIAMVANISNMVLTTDSTSSAHFTVILEELRGEDGKRNPYNGPDNGPVRGNRMDFTSNNRLIYPQIRARRYDLDRDNSETNASSLGSFVLENRGTANVLIDEVLISFSGSYAHNSDYGPRQLRLALREENGELNSPISNVLTLVPIPESDYSFTLTNSLSLDPGDKKIITVLADTTKVKPSGSEYNVRLQVSLKEINGTYNNDLVYEGPQETESILAWELNYGDAIYTCYIEKPVILEIFDINSLRLKDKETNTLIKEALFNLTSNQWQTRTSYDSLLTGQGSLNDVLRLHDCVEIKIIFLSDETYSNIYSYPKEAKIGLYIGGLIVAELKATAQFGVRGNYTGSQIELLEAGTNNRYYKTTNIEKMVVQLDSNGLTMVSPQSATPPSPSNPVPTPTPDPTPTPVPPTQDDMIKNINYLVTLIVANDYDELLSKINENKNLAREQAVASDYLLEVKSGIVGVVPGTINTFLLNFITYGLDDNSQQLGVGERSAVIMSYKQAYGRMPANHNDFGNVLKIANGRWPGERINDIEQSAIDNFIKVYKRIPIMSDSFDSNAVMIMAYGLRQQAGNRNLVSEAQALVSFQAIYGKMPQSTTEWNILQAITYSGSQRRPDTDKDLLSDQDEVKYGSDPYHPDSDRDSYADGTEVRYGYNPNGSGRIE